MLTRKTTADYLVAQSDQVALTRVSGNLTRLLLSTWAALQSDDQIGLVLPVSDDSDRSQPGPIAPFRVLLTMTF